MGSIATYMENAVTTQSKGQIVVLLYEGAVNFLKRAIVAMENGDMKEKGRLVGKARDIIMELDLSLDVEAGGEIARNLRSLYDFMQRHLLQGHLKNDADKLREVISLLDELNESWREIAA